MSYMLALLAQTYGEAAAAFALRTYNEQHRIYSAWNYRQRLRDELAQSTARLIIAQAAKRPTDPDRIRLERSVAQIRTRLEKQEARRVDHR